MDEGARILGWKTLFLKHVLPATFQQKHFHYKRKTDRTIKEGTVFLTELAKKLNVPLQERKKDELVQVLADKAAMMSETDIPPEILAQLPQKPWTDIKTLDQRVIDDLSEATSGVAMNELMRTFEGFPKSLLELVHQLRENSLFPDESKVAVWMDKDTAEKGAADSFHVLSRACIIRVLAKKDTKTWALPDPFSDPDLPKADAEHNAPSAAGSGVALMSLKRKKHPTGAGGNTSGLASSGRVNGDGTNSGVGVDAGLVTAALNLVGANNRAPTETAAYWKQKEEIERENAKRARIDSEVHRFKTLQDILPTLDDETREQLNRDLQKQKADFCRRLLHVEKVQNDDDNSCV